MSAANAAAIKRRANISADNILASQRRSQEVGPSIMSPSMSIPTNGPGFGVGAGLTLQQAISVIDTRLLYLEKCKSDKDSLEKNSVDVVPDATMVHIEDFNSRFELLAMELDTIKTVVMNLQSYTMDVNRRLLDAKITVIPETNDNIILETQANNDVLIDASSVEFHSSSITKNTL